MISVNKIIDDIIAREGGFVHHTADKGGPTRYGVTLETLKAWRQDNNLTADDVRMMPIGEAQLIYLKRYFEDPGFGALPPVLWPFVVDAAVNHGPASAIKMLQRALGSAADGVLGPATLAAAKSWDTRRLAAGFVAQRARKYGMIITANPSQAAFAAGWAARLAEFIEMLPLV